MERKYPSRQAGRYCANHFIADEFTHTKGNEREYSDQLKPNTMLKKILKRTFQILLLVFIIIQFIRPAKNKAEGISKNDISTRYAVPANVQAILKTSCYDCHSNNTVYPWYAKIQPVTWWL